MLEKLRSLFASAPKTLPQATETITEAKTTIDSVAALFTAAGLNLEQMLAAGADSLKAHLESIDNAEELAEALQENERLQTTLTAAEQGRTAAEDKIAAAWSLFGTLGMKADGAVPAAADLKTAFEAHVQKQTTLALAKTGHPPAHVPAATDPAPAVKSDAELAKEYQTMKAGPERLTFYSQHEAALNRFAKSLGKPE